MKRTLLAVAALLLSAVSAFAATLLPNGEQQVIDANGAPLAGGSVYFYIPGTTTPKDTWQDSAQTILNTNPVVLNASGRAVIFGSGSYRQIVKDANGNTVWDRLTADTSSGSVAWGGRSGGSPNALTLSASTYSATDGQIVSFIASTTNSGSATLNVNGLGDVQIVRDQASGYAPLTGGELVSTNVVSVIYDATNGLFHIISPVTWPNTSGVPVGTVLAHAGFTAPSGYAFAYGQAVSRLTYAGLMGAFTSVQNGSMSSGSPTITGLSDTSQFAVGQAVEAVGIPAATTIASIVSGTSITLSANATSTRTGAITVFAYGNGDGINTFNLPDLRGRAVAGRDSMGGSAAGRLTSSFFGAATALGAAGGAESLTLSIAQMPSHNHTLTDPGHTHSFTINQAATGAAITAGGVNWAAPSIPNTTGSSTTGITMANTGGGSPFRTVQPTMTVNFVVRLTP